MAVELENMRLSEVILDYFWKECSFKKKCLTPCLFYAMVDGVEIKETTLSAFYQVPHIPNVHLIEVATC